MLRLIALQDQFQLTQAEVDVLSKSQNVILNKGSGRGSNLKYLPWVFTEQGVYMLMSVLKGEIAVKQSIALIRAFKAMKADAAYISIYSQTKKSILTVDDYIGTKTLHLLQDVKNGVKVTIFSDNTYNILTASDYKDYQKQFPGRTITFQKTMGKAHDRFIVLDYGTKDERVFHCGPSSKEAGNKLAAVTEFAEGDVKKAMHDVVSNMLGNLTLRLK